MQIMFNNIKRTQFATYNDMNNKIIPQFCIRKSSYNLKKN